MPAYLVRVTGAALLVVLLTSCGGSGAHGTIPSQPLVQGTLQSMRSVSPSAASQRFKYVIVIVQENRSFDNMFHGFPGANSANTGMGHGKVYTLQPVHLKWPYVLNHSHSQFLEDYDNGKMDGFNDMIEGWVHGCKDFRNHPACWRFYPQQKYKQMAYSYVKESDIEPYWTMAKDYALGDNTFTSNSGPTFPAHQYYIAGQSDHASEVPSLNPWGCDGPPSSIVVKLAYGYSTPPHDFSKATGHEVNGPHPCFDRDVYKKTIADLLDAKSVSWHYYVSKPITSSLNGFDAVKAVRYGPDWANMEVDTNFSDDVKNGNLAHVSWVTPEPLESDHPGPDSGSGGPDWVASVVNAVGESKYWNNCAIFIMWDDWGGWYDHVAPPQIPDVETGAYEGLGFRTPLIVISPYVKTHYISHQQYELVSSMSFIEKVFDLGNLGMADARAQPFDDFFNDSHQPAPFQPIPSHLNAHYFMTHQDSGIVDEE
ncbi:MAG: alkaline phosphatase family protein [Candidatus Tumulicola sp.]